MLVAGPPVNTLGPPANVVMMFCAFKLQTTLERAMTSASILAINRELIRVSCGVRAGVGACRDTTPTTLRAADFLRSAANELSSTSRAVLVYGVQLSDALSHF